jgi:hypothetical protein
VGPFGQLQDAITAARKLAKSAPTTANCTAMAYTLGQAAKATAKSKTAIALAIKDKRLSATKDEVGNWQIEPTELYRLYPRRTDGLYAEPKEESERLRVKLEGLEKLCAQIKAERGARVEELEKLCSQTEAERNAKVEGLEKLRRQLEGERDSLREQNTRLIALVEHMPLRATI